MYVRIYYMYNVYFKYNILNICTYTVSAMRYFAKSISKKIKRRRTIKDLLLERRHLRLQSVSFDKQ